MSGEETRLLYEFSRPPPRPLLPTDVWLGRPHVRVLSLERLPTKELARQLTLREQELFRSVPPWEFQSLAFSKKDNKTRAPNMYAMTQHFNRVSKWVAWEILGCAKQAQRSAMIERAIDLADHCHRLQNYNAVNEIISAFNSSAVHRLHAAWDGISAAANERYQELNDLMAAKKNYQALRNKIRTIEPPCVPYPGIYLTDLTFLEEGNPTMKDDMVNWQKCSRQAAIIVKIQTYQCAPYCLKPVPWIQDLITALDPDMDDDAMWEASLRVEPRDGGASSSLTTSTTPAPSTTATSTTPN